MAQQVLQCAMTAMHCPAEKALFCHCLPSSHAEKMQDVRDQMNSQVVEVGDACILSGSVGPQSTRSDVDGLACVQDDSLRGLLHGIYIGVSGILLKPMSGCLSLLSELCTGASGKIKAWGEDAHRRPPIGRVRPPRQFSALSSDIGGAPNSTHDSFHSGDGS